MWIWYDSASVSQLRGVILDLSGKQKRLGAVFVTALIAALTVFLNWFSAEEPPPPPADAGPLLVPGLPAAEDPPAEEGAPEHMGPDGEAMLGTTPTVNEEPAADVE